MTPLPKDVLTSLIAKVGEQDDNRVFDQHFAQRCREFDAATMDPVNFLRDLLDMCVYGSGCSDSMIRIFHVILEGHPETEEEKEVRRADLLERWGVSRAEV